MIIYRNIAGVKTILHEIEVDTNTELQQKIAGQDVITSRFTISEDPLDLKIGDFVEFKDSVYTILDEPQVKKIQNTFAYNLQFKSDQYILKNVQLFNPGTEEVDFFLFGDAQDMISLIISNLNRVYGQSGEYYADYVEETTGKLVGFNNLNCLGALQKLAVDFECEYRVQGKKITFRKKIGTETGLTFKYKDGLKAIERQVISNSEVITVLYPQGSERNITNEYGSTRLKIPKLEKNVNIFGTIERTVTFDDIYPRLNGSVSSVNGITKFTDTGIDFDINAQLIGGLKAKVIFNTGDLAGREFEIFKYNNSIKEIDLITYTDDSDLTLPNDILKPRVGDKYVLVNIKMPQSYIDEAEAELLERATEYLDKYSQPNVIYRIAPHYPRLRERNTHFNLGDIITVIDEDFGINLQTRILALNQKVYRPFEYSLDIGSQATVSYFTQVMTDQKDLRNNIYLNNKYITEQFNRIFNNIKEFTAPLYVNRGEFNPANYYYNNQNRRDFVFRWEGTEANPKKVWYFYIGQDHDRSEWIQANWQLIGDQFEIIATETILAQNANIGNWLIQNGQIVSQATYVDPDNEANNTPRVHLNGSEGFIKLVSGVEVLGDAGYRTYKEELFIDSRTGEIRATREGDDSQVEARASFSSNGVAAEFSGIDVITPPGFAVSQNVIGKTSVLGDGTAKLDRTHGDWDFVAGIVGMATNKSSNPSPAYGGVFFGLKSYGRYVGVERIPSNVTEFYCGEYEELLSCYNTSTLDVFLPPEPVAGRKIEVRRVNALVNVKKTDVSILAGTVDDTIDINYGDTWTFIYDGMYWLANFKGRNDA